MFSIRLHYNKDTKFKKHCNGINNRRSFCCFKNNLERINEDKIFRKVCEKYNFNQYIYVITYRGIFSKAVIIKRFNYAFV